MSAFPTVIGNHGFLRHGVMPVVGCNLVSSEIRRNIGNFQFCNIRRENKWSLKSCEEAKNEEWLLLLMGEVIVFGVETNHLYP